MKALWIFIFCACTNFLLPVIAFSENLTIATFNVEFLTKPKVHIKYGFPFNLKKPADIAKWSASGFRDQKFNEAAKAVAEVIANIDADVIALVEAGDKDDVNELNKEIDSLGVKYNHLSVCECTDRNTHQHVAVLSKFPFKEELFSISGREGYDKELDDPETEANTGVSKGMRVSFNISNHKINFYAIHLASERNGHEQDSQRIAQASIVRRHYLPLLNAGEHVIVAGDLNDRRGEPALRRIRGRDDIWEDLIQTGSLKYFEKGKEGMRWTYTFQGIRNQIDHILLSQSFKQITKRSKGIKAQVTNQKNPLASDHRPFIATLNLK